MWKERFHTFLQKTNLNGQDSVILLLSVLLAFTIWLIHNLSLNYSSTMSVPVVAVCNIEGHSNVSSNSSLIVARCRTSGFSLVRNSSMSKRNAIRIMFDSKDMHHKDGEIFYITSAELSNYVNEIFGEGVRLESFVSDTFQFRFPYENNKKVIVQAETILSFRPQYAAVGGMKVMPDSITIYGEPFHLEHVDRVFTKTIELSDIRSSSHGTVKLEPINGVRMSVSEVNYSLDVTRFVEIKDDVAIIARNVPVGKELKIFPSTAKVTYKCTFPLSEDPSDVVSFYIDYSDFERSLGGKCIAKARNIPKGVIEYTLDPEVFDCVEEDRK
ncbi:MAG: hypothetical protein PUK70_06295 [Bacteroidales bacterium]|nr:hypothetical protein [Bacteroidales bacterium]MDY6001321.1 hypothetical protein [Candidatus Cryptobacteroides sp.]